jgi:hypothetical protein
MFIRKLNIFFIIYIACFFLINPKDVPSLKPGVSLSDIKVFKIVGKYKKKKLRRK